MDRAGSIDPPRLDLLVKGKLNAPHSPGRHAVTVVTGNSARHRQRPGTAGRTGSPAVTIGRPERQNRTICHAPAPKHRVPVSCPQRPPPVPVATAHPPPPPDRL